MSRVSAKLERLPVLGGALCLDFVNTIDPRHREPRQEFIGDYSKLVRWGAFIGAIATEQADALTAAGLQDEGQAQLVHARALELRQALYRIFIPARAQAQLAPDLATLTLEWRNAMSHASIDSSGGQFHRRWQAGGELDLVLWPVIDSAIELLFSPLLHRVRECDGEGCGWLFVDTSRSRRRRWCSMAICGNREKARRHRQRTHP